MTAADDIKAWLQGLPELAGWRLQFGRWIDSSKADRYAVLRSVGGGMASLLREPRFTLLLVGRQGDAETQAYDMAYAVAEASRAYTGGLVQLQAGEPVTSTTHDGRPTAEVAITTIAN